MVSSPDSSPEAIRRRRKKIRRHLAEDDGGEEPLPSLDVGTVDASTLLHPVESPAFAFATVPPCDTQSLLPVLGENPISTSLIPTTTTNSVSTLVGAVQTVTAFGMVQIADSAKSTVKQGTVVDGADIVGPCPQSTSFDVMDMASHLSAEPLAVGVPPPSPLPLDVPSEIKPNTMVVSSDGDWELEWEHFIQCGAPSPSHVDFTLEDNMPEDSSGVEVQSEELPSCSAGQPLFPSSSLNVEDCVVTILTYALTEHLNSQAFSRLLALINIILPKPNSLPNTLAQFYKYFETESVLHVFYFCNICWKARTSLQDSCTDCTDPRRRVKYFITSPVAPQLSRMFSRAGFVEKLNYKYVREKVSQENIEDVYDGHVYKAAEESVLCSNSSNSISVSLTWYTDGISIYENSPYSLWPFMFIINELPPADRYKPENLILAGLWGCDEKPHPNVFLLPIYQDLMTVNRGFSVKIHGSEEPVCVKAYLLKGTCDVPAKATFMAMKGHSGYSSCPKCLIVGEKSAATGNVLVFPHEDDLRPRTTEHYNFCVQESSKSKDGYLGIFGPTLLSYMTSSDFIASVAIDSMHCVDIGITKQMLKLWFDPAHSSEPFSMTQKIDVVNRRLFALRLPHFVQRAPLGVDKLSFRKASLLLNFLLYMALPVMHGVMPEHMFENLSLLVNGISLYHKSSISPTDLETADRLLCQFCKSFEVLYGKRNMSSNVHLLRHLGQTVKETGNLWSSSCYRFVDVNGKLALLAHGTTHASLQIYQHFFTLSDLDICIQKVHWTALKSFCQQLNSHKKSLYITDKISSHTYVIGNYTVRSQYGQKILERLSTVLHTPFQYQAFSRLLKNRLLFTTSSYTRGRCVSHYCRYRLQRSVYHGVILVFVKSSPAVHYFALISRSVNLPSLFERYLRESHVNDSNIDLVRVEDLECVSFFINVGNQTYVVDPLNTFDMV